MNKQIARLHCITQDLDGCPHAQLAEEACKGGARWVQLRTKGCAPESWKEIAIRTLAVCREYGAKLIINDNVQLALETGADGVHLGKEDMPVNQARAILGDTFIIGATANTFDDIRSHAAMGADYIGLGPYRFTRTKKNLSPVLGLAGYADIMEKCRTAGIDLPVIAIGGVLTEDVPLLLQTGVSGIAVSSAINLAADKPAQAARFLRLLPELFTTAKSVSV